MCGIVGYVGARRAAPIVLECLKRLEYRGYDSAGIATISGNLQIKKDQGKISEIHEKLDLSDMPGTIGMGHTRWATHGEPSLANAHPHTDCKSEIVLVHNGIIENYLELKEELEAEGHRFASRTDTEAITHLIERYLEKSTFEQAVVQALRKIKGSYALVIGCKNEPEKLVLARQYSPLVIGIGKHEFYAASDIPAFLNRTKRTIILEDREYAVLTKDKCEIRSLQTGKKIPRAPKTVNWTPKQAEKGGYPYFMLKEIYDQPEAISETLRSESEIRHAAEKLSKSGRLYITGCGTSYHAGLAGKYLFERILGMQTEAVIASEFPESTYHAIKENDAVIAITQSGETADTLSAARLAKQKGAQVFCITNVLGSSITRIADHPIYTRAGPEISVVATKTFLSQLILLSAIAAQAAKERGTDPAFGKELRKAPELIQKILDRTGPAVRRLAEKYHRKNQFYYLGRGISYPSALEGALKMKEISYIPSEGFAAGELKHGPLALIEKGSTVIVLCPRDAVRTKTINAIEQVRARGAEVIAVCTEGDSEIKKLATHTIEIPADGEYLTPLLFVVPLQLFAYHIAVKKGLDPDRPRNLAKSVTVE